MRPLVLRYARGSCVVAIAALGLLVPELVPTVVAGWEFSGEFGGEFDAIGEEFGSGALVDEQIDSTDPLEDAVDELRFEDQTTESNAILTLRLHEAGGRLFDGRATLESRKEKSRAGIDARGEVVGRFGGLRWAERLDTEFGGREADGGWVQFAEAAWSPRTASWRRHPEVSVSYEISRAGADSLDELFAYQLVRPRVEFALPGVILPLRFSLGTEHKRLEGAGGADYDGSWAELRSVALRSSVGLRIDSRGYTRADSLTPSFQETSLEAEHAVGAGRGGQVRAEFRGRLLSYARDSTIFRDHGEAGLGVYWRRELGRPRPAVDGGAGSGSSGILPRVRPGADPGSTLERLDGALADLAALEAEFAGGDSAVAVNGRVATDRSTSGGLGAGARWVLEFGALAEGSWGERAADGDFVEWSGRASIGRQADERFWFDGGVEVGRRDYAVDRGSSDLVFEGFDFSVAGSDYDFAEASILGDVGLPARFILEFFAQAEVQRHRDSADDFRLWILNLSLLRRF